MWRVFIVVLLILFGTTGEAGLGELSKQSGPGTSLSAVPFSLPPTFSSRPEGEGEKFDDTDCWEGNDQLHCDNGQLDYE